MQTLNYGECVDNDYKKLMKVWLKANPKPPQSSNGQIKDWEDTKPKKPTPPKEVRAVTITFKDTHEWTRADNDRRYLGTLSAGEGASPGTVEFLGVIALLDKVEGFKFSIDKPMYWLNVENWIKKVVYDESFIPSLEYPKNSSGR